jgi:phosphoribosylformylglycinamidine cyclo-ligase
MVKAFAEAARENECTLTGGETSWQPGTIAEGVYVLTASIIGVVEKEKIIDGSKIQKGDVLLALPSSGVHTNGFSLVRKIMKESPDIEKEMVSGPSTWLGVNKPFIESVLTPHRAYYTALKGLFGKDGLVGLAHITGGGIQENLNRVLPEKCGAHVELPTIRIHPIFKTLKNFGQLDDADMLRTFNMGVGMVAVVRKEFAGEAVKHLATHGVDAYEVGKIGEGEKSVTSTGELQWA